MLGSRFAICPPKKRFPKALHHLLSPFRLTHSSAPPSPLSFPSRSIALNTSHEIHLVLVKKVLDPLFARLSKALPLRPIVILSSFSVIYVPARSHRSYSHIRSTWPSHPLWSISSFLFCLFFFQVPDFRSHKRKMDKRRVREEE